MSPPDLHPTGLPLASWRRDLFWLLLLFGFLNFFVLGRAPLANPDEGRYAEIPREMIASGDWVTPRLNAVPYFEKPPLVYWCVAVMQKIFGPSEWAARATPALFGLGGVILTYAAGRRLRGREAGLAAAIVLGTSLIWFAHSRLLILDMAVSVLMSAALFCFILGVGEAPGARRRWLFYGLYASMALATLTKGLIGFMVTGAVMFLWLLVFNQWKRLRPLHLPTGALIFLAIAAPWHVLAAQRNPGWAHFYFVHEHWERFTTTEHGRAGPVYYFVPVVLLGLFPWVGFLWPALREAVAGGWARRKENADAWFLVTWAAFVFLFFSKSQSKLIPYILPVFPPLAVIIGAWVARQWNEGVPARLRAGLNVFAFGCGLLGVALLVAVLKPGVIREPDQVEAIRPYAYGLAAVLFAGGIAAPGMAKIRGVKHAFGALVMAVAVFFLGLALAVPPIRSTKALALVAAAKLQPEDRVFHYQGFFHDFTYYTRRPVGLVNYQDELELQFLDPKEKAERFIDEAELRRQWNGPQRIWLVARQRDAQLLKQDDAFRYHLIAESPTHYLLSNRP